MATAGAVPQPEPVAEEKTLTDTSPVRAIVGVLPVLSSVTAEGIELQS
jgi:hypothetical protein